MNCRWWCPEATNNALGIMLTIVSVVVVVVSAKPFKFDLQMLECQTVNIYIYYIYTYISLAGSHVLLHPCMISCPNLGHIHRVLWSSTKKRIK